MPGNLTDPAETKVLDAINGVASALYTAPLKLRILSAIATDSAAGTQFASSTDQTITFATGGASSNSQTYSALSVGDCKGWEINDNAAVRIWRGLWSPVDTATAQATGDTITQTAHGLANGAKVVFDTVRVPTGLTAGTTYFVVGQTANTFQVSLTSGGAAVDITADAIAGTITYGLIKTVANAGDSLVVNTGAITTSVD